MSDQHLTQQDSANRYSEEWEVFVSNQKEPFILNEKEYQVFNKALRVKSIVNFDWGSINTAFFVSSYLKKKRLKPQYQLKAPEEKEVELSPDQIAHRKEIMDGMRKRLGIKFSVNKER